jgi:hypothetical protein
MPAKCDKCGEKHTNCFGPCQKQTKAPALPSRLVFEPMSVYQEKVRLTGKPLEPHEGYMRDNDGSWKVSSPDGPVLSVAFRGKAKRGEAWNAPDPEGQAIAFEVVRRYNQGHAFDMLVEAAWAATKDLDEFFRDSIKSKIVGAQLSSLVALRSALALAKEAK